MGEQRNDEYEMPQSDHDRILLMWPRVGALEESRREMKQKQDRLETSVESLHNEMRTENGKTQAAIADTRQKLTERIDEGLKDVRKETGEKIDGVNAHLDVQDGVLSDVKLSLERRRPKWTPAQIAWNAAAGLVISVAIGAVITGLMHHW